MVVPLSYFSLHPVLHDWYKKRPWYVISCLWNGAYKRSIAPNRKEYLSGPLPYIRRYINVNKCIECVVKKNISLILWSSWSSSEISAGCSTDSNSDC